ncbi:hypothetical protein GCM10010126_17890 [Planomonospora parontospora]|uniref:Glycosyltransferase n=2 Tax=Planomonospora parontospora TaxID=58119 RepID=A0AA37F3D7_9ACTN|nr:hypothetical protein GCM10010126_17890 [Planomonospora parontospora]
MRVCFGTVVHHPEDARIMHRQIRALLDAGHEITYVAPFSDCNVTPDPRIRAVDVPRAAGRRRRRALGAARAALERGVEGADLLVVHDVELLLRLPRRRPATVWDVREDPRDLAADLAADARLPAGLFRSLPALVRRIESRAERRLHLVLAGESHRERFGGPHPVVPDTARVPRRPPLPPGHQSRVVHLGRISHSRGAAELVELARRLAPHGIRLDLIGPADGGTRPLLRDAQREGLLDWYGHVPDRHALRMAEGSIAGLSFRHDSPGRERPAPTKIIEYMSRGIPVVTTPVPAAAALVDRVRCGAVVPFGDVGAAVRAVLALRDDPSGAAATGARGRAEAALHHDWSAHAAAFVNLLEEWAGEPVTAGRELGSLEPWHAI